MTDYSYEKEGIDREWLNSRACEMPMDLSEGFKPIRKHSGTLRGTSPQIQNLPRPETAHMQHYSEIAFYSNVPIPESEVTTYGTEVYHVRIPDEPCDCKWCNQPR